MKKEQSKMVLAALSMLVATVACSKESEVPASGVTAATTGAAATPAAVVTAQHLQLVKLGASMHAAAEACGMDPAERAALREQQKKATVAGGTMSAAQFDVAFDAALDGAKAKFASATPEQRKQACSQLEQMRPAGSGG